MEVHGLLRMSKIKALELSISYHVTKILQVIAPTASTYKPQLK